MTQAINRRDPLLLSRLGNFYQVPHAEKYGIEDSYFDVADIIKALSEGLSPSMMGDIGDEINEAQLNEITRQYEKFIKRISKLGGETAQVVELKKEIQTLKMGAGRLRAKIKKLEAAANEKS